MFVAICSEPRSGGSLAQLVEQRTFNPLVESSNLSRPTISKLFFAGLLAQLVEQRTLNPLVAGSTPSQPTTWMLSSVWLEHLPYKQRVIGSSPIASTIHHRPIPQFFKMTNEEMICRFVYCFLILYLYILKFA